MTDDIDDVPEVEIDADADIPEEKPTDYLADVPEEDQKYAKGWNPNNPKGKSLERFISDGKLMEANNKIKQVRNESEAQKKALIRLNEANLRVLEERYKEAVNMSDGKAAREILQEINSAEAEKNSLSVSVDMNIVKSWEQSNSWVYDRSSPKSVYANSVFAEAISQGKSTEEALEEVDYRVELKFSESKPDKAPKTTTSQTPSGRTTSKGVSMATLTREEKLFYNELNGKGAWKDEKEFLKIIEESRREDK